MCIRDRFTTYRGLESAKPGNLPQAHKMADEVICLPMHHAVTEEDIQRILCCIMNLSLIHIFQARTPGTACRHRHASQCQVLYSDSGARHRRSTNQIRPNKAETVPSSHGMRPSRQGGKENVNTNSSRMAQS